MKDNISSAELANMLWDCCEKWPEKHGSDLLESFKDASTEERQNTLDESVYFLAFVSDFSIFTALDNRPEIRSIVRDVFTSIMRMYALNHCCRPIPSGQWIEGLWIPFGETPDYDGNPGINVQQRFRLYSEGMGKQDNFANGAAKVFAGLCGTIDIAFITYSTVLFTNIVISIKDIISGVEISIY